MGVAITGSAQHNLPKFTKEKVCSTNDWLLYGVDKPAKLYKDQNGHLFLRNGLVSRTFSINPNGHTIGLEHLQTGETFLRSLRTEAEVQINGITFEVGGLTGQPIHNYLLPEWIESMSANPASFKLNDYKIAFNFFISSEILLSTILA